MRYTHVWETGQERHVILDEQEASLQQQQYILLHNGHGHLVVQVCDDRRRFRVFPGWVQVVEGENGGVTTMYTVVDTRYPLPDIPTVITLLATVLRQQVQNTQRCAQPKTRAAHLRWLAVFVSNAGWLRTPLDWHVVRGGCAMYWDCPEAWRPWMTQEQWDRLADFAARYRRFCHYWMEQAPGWTRVKEIVYADTSTEVVEVSRRSGAYRRRMTSAPRGDRCF